MAKTTVRISTVTRDRLATVAREDFGGISQEAALDRLLEEHEIQQVHAAYERLAEDADEWASYLEELGMIDAASGDGLADAHSEFPEYQR